MDINNTFECFTCLTKKSDHICDHKNSAQINRKYLSTHSTLADYLQQRGTFSAR